MQYSTYLLMFDALLHFNDLCTYCWIFFLLPEDNATLFLFLFFGSAFTAGNQTLIIVRLIRRLRSEKMPYLRFLYLVFSPSTPFSFWQPSINKESSFLSEAAILPPSAPPPLYSL